MLDHYYKVVAGDRLEKYGEFPLIDKLAKEYNYTHEQAYNLPWRVAYTIMALGRETSYIENEASRQKNRDKAT